MESVIQGIYSSFACFFFAIIYNTPRRELFFCGVTGGIGYGIYHYCCTITSAPVISTFMGTVAIVICARIFSIQRNMPVMLYILPSIFPLVPGANMYHAMYGLLTNNTYTATSNAIAAFKLSGITVLAMVITMSIPLKVFNFVKRKSKDIDFYN